MIISRIKQVLLFAAGIFWYLSGVVIATPSTHIWAPSTDIQPFSKWHITSDMYLPVTKDEAGIRWSTVTNLGLTVGVLPFKNINLEIGLDHKSGTGVLDDYPLYFNAKLGTPEDGLAKYVPALAVGIYDVGTKKNQTNNNVIYTEAAKTLKSGKTSIGRFSVGYFFGNEKLLLDDKGEKDNQGPILAWERTMDEISHKLWVCAEYMGTKSSYGTINFGFSWKFADNVSMIFGYDIFNNRDIPDVATLQLDIDF